MEENNYRDFAVFERVGGIDAPVKRVSQWRDSFAEADAEAHLWAEHNRDRFLWVVSCDEDGHKEQCKLYMVA